MNFIDAETYKQAKARDKNAQQFLYDRFHGRILAFCYSLTRDRELAADLTQNVFLKMLSKIDTLESPESFPSWLMAIARNEVYQHFRKTRSMQALDEDDVWETNTPVEEMIAAERAAIVRRLVDSLQPSYRDVLVLREFDGLTYSEIARVVGCTETAVKARLFKARKAMLEKITQLLGEE